MEKSDKKSTYDIRSISRAPPQLAFALLSIAATVGVGCVFCFVAERKHSLAGVNAGFETESGGSAWHSEDAGGEEGEDWESEELHFEFGRLVIW